MTAGRTTAPARIDQFDTLAPPLLSESHTACGACSRARGVTVADLSNYGAKFGNPAIFVSLVEWSDRVINE